MADVDSVVFTQTEQTRSKTRKVKKTTKRRESRDQNAEVTITELDSTQNNVNNHNDVGNAIEEYVLAVAAVLSLSSYCTGGSFILLFPASYPLLFSSLLSSLLLDLDSRAYMSRYSRMPDIAEFRALALFSNLPLKDLCLLHLDCPS